MGMRGESGPSGPSGKAGIPVNFNWTLETRVVWLLFCYITKIGAIIPLS